MRLTETLNKIKKIKHYPDLPKDTFAFLVLILVGFGAFFLGQLSVSESKRGGELRITDSGVSSGAALSEKDSGTNVPTQAALSGEKSISENTPGMYVGSKSGKTYYLPWCGGVKRIKEENKVWFSSKADAESRGYKPSATCRGI